MKDRNKELERIISKVNVRYGTSRVVGTTGKVGYLHMIFAGADKTQELTFAKHFFTEEDVKKAETDMKFIAKELFMNGMVQTFEKDRRLVEMEYSIYKRLKFLFFPKK